MIALVPLILGLVTPLVGRVLTALGLSVVTFTGLNIMLQQVSDAASSAWGGLPSDVLALATLAGIPEALSILFGAVATKVALLQATAFAKRVGANPG